MDEEQIERYCRHILLPEVDIIGQEKLLQSRILIIGMGGLGAPAAMYLASSGVGKLTICDDDQVELNNVQRQIIHTTHDIGRNKVDSALDTLKALNPDITINPINRRLHQTLLSDQVSQADAVIDASDNFATRFELNKVCVKQRTALISGAVVRFSGQVIVFRNDRGSPCYRCLYPDNTPKGDAQESCHEAGILAPVAGIIGTTIATETLKLILDIGASRASHLLRYDAKHAQWHSTRLIRDPECPVCSKNMVDRLPHLTKTGISA